MSKISMMFQIVTLLQTHYLLNSTELAEILETSPRNIKAYIEALRMAGVPIEGITGRNGGYFLSSVYEFTPPKLDVKEYNALLLAEEILTDKNSFFHEHEIKRAFAKIKVAQGKMDKSELVDNQQNIFTSAYMDISPEVKKHLSSIRKAIFDKKRISITYRSPTRNHTTIRKIDPYNLIYRNSSWYVIGHCHLRDKIRIFKLMRIKEMEVLDRSYHIPSDFSIKNYMRNTLDLINTGKEYTVEIQFFHPASAWVSEKLWLPTQKIMWLEDDSIIFKARVNGLTDIKKWVLGYGSFARILKPQELVNKMRDEITKMQNHYEKRDLHSKKEVKK